MPALSLRSLFPAQMPGLERGLLLQLLPRDANDARGVVLEASCLGFLLIPASVCAALPCLIKR